jgi:hypothetical protein
LQSLNSHVSVIDFFFLLVDLSFEFLNEFEGIAGGCLFLFVLVDEVVVFVFEKGLLGFDGGEAKR